MNLAVITADDFSAYSIHQECCPTIYEFAQNNFNFKNAHCNITFCQPSRSVLMTGLYPQNNGSTEFKPIKESVKTLPLILKQHGYFTSIIGKNHHHKPPSVYKWDFEYAPSLGQMREDTYLKNILTNLKKGIVNEPYFILINLRYPHRPFIASKTSAKVIVPPFLNDDPVTRRELANYYQSVKALDTAFKEIISHLDAYIVFTSDHGMSFPFVKGNCYHHSTNVPLIYKIGRRQVDTHHLVSHVDFAPTILDLLNIHKPDFDGQSYFPLLKTGEQEGFQTVYCQLNRMLSGPPIRIRSIITKECSYVLNIDTDYPAMFVDGWEWQGYLKNFHHPKLYKRKTEELIGSQDTSTLYKMRTMLLSKMAKFNDPLLKEAVKKIDTLKVL